MEEKTTFTTKEAAKQLGISTATIYRMEKRGLIAAIKTPGGQRRFTLEDLNNYSIQSRNIKGPFDPSKYKNIIAVKETNINYQIDTIPITYTTEKPFFSKDGIEIYNSDILKINCIQENSIDLIVTSPPYNVDIKYNSHNDTMSYEDYIIFTYQWIKKCYKFLKSDGRFCLNIPLDKNKGGHQSVYADITTIAKKVGFKYHSTIIWNEQNISRRTAWGSWLSATAPFVIAPVEVIVVLYKKSRKKTNSSRISDIERKEFMEWTNSFWNFSGESKTKIGHPAPFPIELPRRCIKLFSFVGDTVLDPFLGSGSTLLACLKTNRNGIGIEIDKNYCLLAEKRLNTFFSAQNQNSLLL